jgi:pimeloyl-ACP methyl ester carboxylesterase
MVDSVPKPRNPVRGRARVILLPLCLLAMTVLLLGPGTSALALEGSGSHRGTLDGAVYQVEMPASWNGTLLLYSHGYTAVGTTPKQIDAPGPTVAAWLLSHGYALAGSAYARQGWAVEDGLRAQTALLDDFRHRHPGLHRTVAWGMSMGGLITETLAERDPSRIQGALTMCAPLGGAVGEWNARLDSAFAFKTLLAPGSRLAVTDIDDGAANMALARRILDQSQSDPVGRARIALASALGGVPGWIAGQPAAETTPDAIEQAQYRQWHGIGTNFLFLQRASVEQRAGGNPSWNTGVDYRAVLTASGQEATVRALYAQAGLPLDHDLRRLATAPRIAGDSRATSYLARYASPTGGLGVPVLAVHTLGDTLVPAAEEHAFARTVAGAHNQHLLRQLTVARGGHCAFTVSEQVVALQVLEQRLQNRAWPATGGIAELQGRGATIGLGEARFTAAQPGAFSRPYVPSHRS